MKILKKLTSFLLCTVLLLSMLSVIGVSAYEEEPVSYPMGDGEVYFDPATGTVTGWNGSITLAQIPEEIGGVPVTAIGERAFNRCFDLEEVVIPDTVTVIGEFAFANCYELQKVTLSDSVTTIGNYGFYNCENLGDITFGEGEATIGDYAFAYCSGLRNVSLGSGVTALGEGAFYFCESLTEIELPQSLTSFGGKAFYYCRNLREITIPQGVKVIEDMAFFECTGLTKVTLSEGVTTIGSGAFYACESLSEIPLPNGVSTIGEGAFRLCTALTEMIMPDSVTSLGISAFEGCTHLVELSISDNVKILDSYVFFNCSALESVTIPEGVTAIEKGAFMLCDSLTEIAIPDSVEEIGEGAFDNCASLTAIRVGENNVYYSTDSAGVLLNKDRTALIQYPCGREGAYVLPETVTTICKGAFMNSEKLTEVTLHEGLTTIEDAAFSFCGGLISVTIPESVTSLGSYVFHNCTALTEAKVLGHVNIIEESTFANCYSLQSVTLPAGLEVIDGRAFSGCLRLSYVNLPEGLVYIGNNAFAECRALESITLPDSVETIEEYAFSFCENLREMNIPENVSYIGHRVFSGCAAMTGIWVAEENIFYSSDSYGVLYNKYKTLLMCYPAGKTGEYVIAETCMTIGNEAFAGSGLTWVEIPCEVTSIGDAAFRYCTELRSVTIPASVTLLSTSVFEGCSSLSHVHLMGDMFTIYASAFYGCAEEMTLCYRDGAEIWDGYEGLKELWDYTETMNCGKVIYTCNTCGDSYSLKDEDGHPWILAQELLAPTCTEKGSARYICPDCEATKITDIAPTGHEQGTLIQETENYWEYACLKADHNYIVYKDSRMNAMFLEDVTVAFSDSESYPWEYSQEDPVTGWDSIRSTNRDMPGCVSQTSVFFVCDREFVLSFEYLVSSEENYDKLTIYLDGEPVVNEVSGEVSGTYASETLEAGTHELTLIYNKDGSANGGEDRAYLYNLKAIATGEKPEPPITAQDPTLKLNHTLNLASDISINYLIPKTLLEGYDMSTVYLESLIETYNGNEQMGIDRFITYPVENGEYYYFTLTGLAAIHMNNEINSVIRGVKDGVERHSPIDRYSIATYAYSQMNNPKRPNSLKTLCADLLRYGAKAQLFKGYRTDAPADSAMTEEHKSYLSDLDAVTFGQTNRVLNDLPNAPIIWTGKALNLESKVCLKFIFDTGSYVGDPTALTLRISYNDINGVQKTAVIENVEVYNLEFGLYSFTVDVLLAAELRSVVSAQIYAGDTPVSATLQYRADAYGNNKTGVLLDLCKALMAYSDSAKAFFKN